jgi:membrane protein DedA with SNARE-associated domain
MSRLSERYGPSLIVLTRGVPVLAEASVLLLGLERLAWRRFLPPMLLSNLGLALAYSVFGHIAWEYDSMPLALAVSILLPVIVAAIVQRRLGSERRETRRGVGEAGSRGGGE